MLNGYVSHNQRVYTVDRNNSQTWNKPNLGMILPKRKIYGFWLWAELVKIYPESIRIQCYRNPTNSPGEPQAICLQATTW
jgi:hypothetical protein